MRSSALLLLCLTSTALAAPDPAAILEIDRDPTLLRATLINVPDAQPADITLTADTGERVTASSVTPYARMNQPVAIALLYCSGEIFIGNEEHETQTSARYHGMLNALKAALDQPAFTTAFPPNSQLVALQYDAGVRIRFPLGPLDQFAAATLGAERDYRGRVGNELVQGIELALDQLDRTTTPRRVLIVISDGTDTDPDTAKARLALLKKRAAQAGVEVYGIIFKSAVSDEASVITTMIPGARLLRTTEGMDAAMATITAQIGRRYEVTFPHAKLPHDGKAHELTITAGQTVLDSITFVLPAPADSGWSVCWKQLAIGGAIALLVALGLFMKFRLAR